VLYGIIRATSAERAAGITHKVVVFQSNLTCRHRDWDRCRGDSGEEPFRP
jgi:hypothetical protein